MFNRGYKEAYGIVMKSKGGVGTHLPLNKYHNPWARAVLLRIGFADPIQLIIKLFGLR